MENGKEIVTAWVTKYALTQGILERTGYVDGHYFVLDGHSRAGWWALDSKHLWFNKADAIAKAKEMQQRKVAALEAQLAKVKSLSFEE